MNKASSDLCRLVGIERPIFQAGMAFVTTGRIAAAVSAAGGLGCIATGGIMGSDELRGHIVRVRDEAPGKPFAVNVLLPTGADDSATMGGVDFTRMQLDTCFEEKVPVIISGLGNPVDVIDEIHAHGSKLVCVVGTVRAALKVASLGADAVVLSGSEAGGHCGPVGTFSLAQAGIGRIGVPLLLAGGIAQPAAVSAAIALGAAGVSVGTRFIAAEEADAHAIYKQAIIDADERATTVTSACTGKPSRAWRSPFVISWEGREDEVQPYPEQAIEHFWRGYAGAVEGDVEQGFFPMGQCAAAITAILPAATIVELLAAPAEAAV